MIRLVPTTLREANAFVKAHHRHHKPVTGHKFSIGCEVEGRLVGVVIAGRPVSRYLDVCSMLYAAAARAAKAMGYQRIITYTLDNEPGTSLRAAGWTCMGRAGGKRWTGKRCPAVDLCPPQMKLRYEKQL